MRARYLSSFTSFFRHRYARISNSSQCPVGALHLAAAQQPTGPCALSDVSIHGFGGSVRHNTRDAQGTSPVAGPEPAASASRSTWAYATLWLDLAWRRAWRSMALIRARTSAGSAPSRPVVWAVIERSRSAVRSRYRVFSASLGIIDRNIPAPPKCGPTEPAWSHKRPTMSRGTGTIGWWSGDHSSPSIGQIPAHSRTKLTGAKRTSHPPQSRPPPPPASQEPASSARSPSQQAQRDGPRPHPPLPATTAGTDGPSPGIPTRSEGETGDCQRAVFCHTRVVRSELWLPS